MTPELLTLALDHAKRLVPHESCALLIEAQGEPFYWRCENVSGEPDIAIPAFKDLARAEDAGRLLGFVHSHPNHEPFSVLDRKGSEAMQLPWWVVYPSDDTWVRYDPSSRDLLGRRYIFGIDDCWSLFKDWYLRERGLVLIDDVRNYDKWRNGFEHHLANMDAAGFREVAFESLQPGDGLFFAVASRSISHCAIYLGDGVMLHHLEGSLSRTEHITQAWLKRLRKVIRRKA